MVTRSARPPLKHWLVLGVLVLLVHLGLLQSVPIALEPPDSATPLALSFDTRALPPPASVVAAPPSPVVKRPPKATVKPGLPKPDQPAAPAPEPATATAAATPPPDHTEPPPVATAEPAPPPQVAASAPELAPEPDAIATAAAPTPPAATPRHFNAEALSPSIRLMYTLKTNKFPFPVQGELLWHNQGGTYSARLFYGVFGLSREQTSRGHITATGLAPERFSDKYRSELAAHFHHAEHKISFSANTPDAALLPGAQDRLSVLLQLGGLLASAPEHYPPGSTVSIQTAGPRDADVWLFTVVASAALDLAGQATPTVKLERQPRRPYDQKVEVWLAPDMRYLPVRIRITDANGDNVDQVWVASEPVSP